MFNYKLNVFNKSAKPHSEKGSEARDKILRTALRLFRKRGFDATTMRDIAKAARVATGAAYHYFPSKDAMMLAHFAEVQRLHRSLAEQRWRDNTDLRERLTIAYQTIIDVTADDQDMLHVVLRSLADRDHPLSVLGANTRGVREQSIDIYRCALAGGGVSADLMPIATYAAWALHMGLVLYFFFDRSVGFQRTRTLAREAAHMAADALLMAQSPLAKPFVEPMKQRLVSVLVAAELIPSDLQTPTGGTL